MRPKSTATAFLKEEYCAEHPVRHRESDEHAHYKGQTPAGLRQRTNIGKGVEYPRARKEAEVKQSSSKTRPRHAVEQTDEHEGNYVLYVILVTPGQQKTQNFKWCLYVY